MKGLLVKLGVALFVLMVVTIVDLMVRDHVGFVDATFSMVALVAQDEPAALDVRELGTSTKALLALVMVGGLVLVTVLFAFLADRVVALRLEYVLGKRGVPRMKDHIVIIGLGQVGWRVLETLRQYGRPVLVIERDAENRNIGHASKHGATVIVDDPRDTDALVKTNVAEAHSIIRCTDSDLTNLEVALDARELQPDIRVVLRMYDQRLARKVQGAIAIQVAFSSSALAAPAFAAAAIDRTIVNSFFLDSFRVITVRLTVADGAHLTEMTNARSRTSVRLRAARASPLWWRAAPAPQRGSRHRRRRHPHGEHDVRPARGAERRRQRYRLVGEWHPRNWGGASTRARACPERAEGCLWGKHPRVPRTCARYMWGGRSEATTARPRRPRERGRSESDALAARFACS